MIKSKIKGILYFILVSMIIPFVSAGPFDNVINSFYSLNQNVYFTYFITFVLCFILLYGIFSAGLRKAKIFGGGQLDKYGLVIAVILSLMANIGIFTYLGRQGIHNVLEKILGTMGWFGILVLAALLFFSVFAGGKINGFKNFKIKKPCPALLVAGLAVMFLGSYIERDWLVMSGFVMFLFGLICMILNMGKGGGSRPRPGPRPPRPRPGPRPRPPGPTPTPPDFSGELNEINNLLTDYQNTFGRFKQKGDEILLTNHRHQNPPVSGGSFPPVSNAQWIEYNELARMLNTIHGNITGKINQLMGNSRFKDIAANQKRTLMRLLGAWSNASLQTSQYMEDFEDRLNNGDGPA